MLILVHSSLHFCQEHTEQEGTSILRKSRTTLADYHNTNTKAELLNLINIVYKIRYIL